MKIENFCWQFVVAILGGKILSFGMVQFSIELECSVELELKIFIWFRLFDHIIHTLEKLYLVRVVVYQRVIQDSDAESDFGYTSSRQVICEKGIACL